MTTAEIELAREAGGYKALYERAERERAEAVAEVERLRAVMLDELTVLENACIDAESDETEFLHIVEGVVDSLSEGRNPPVRGAQ
jgi:hypothetical protein